MKMPITDLLDHYVDNTVVLPPESEADRGQTRAHGTDLRGRRRRFGWREGLAAAAALAVIVGCGILLKQRLGQQPAQPFSGDPAKLPVTEGCDPTTEGRKDGPVDESGSSDTQHTNPEAPDSQAPDAVPADNEAPAQEHGDGEEEWPQEYPVVGCRLAGDAEGVFSPAGDLTKYRYAPLSGAGDYVSILQAYADQVLDTREGFAPDLETAHDGYCNWFLEAEGVHASVSGSDVTGRFSFNLWPGAEQAAQNAAADRLDEDDLIAKAADFAARFRSVTGELVCLGSRADREQYWSGQPDTPDIRVNTLTVCFRAASDAAPRAELQPGLDIPILCGDSEIEDPSVHQFKVTLWPDGTVVCADNYITRAVPEPDGTCPMLTEADLAKLASFFTSFAENDTLVLRRVAVDHYSVYFGTPEISPVVTVTYCYESSPDEIQHTDIVVEGLLD